MEDQMKFAFMQQGGVLRDDGMNTDPVSGNEVPSGSMAKEVRDDIDAKLSEGEYVVPADVVRFHGVQKFEDLRNQAKQGFGRMERDGRIGGEPVDDNFPIPMNQLQTFDEGGDTSTYEQTFGQPFQMGQRYGDMGAPTNRGYELITYTSPDGKRTIVIPHFNGKPMSAIPTGFAPQGTQTTGGGGVMTDDRQDDENEAQQKKNIGQPVTVDPLMQAQIDKDVELTRPKAPEDFTGEDFLKYVNQTKGFGIDDIARNVPILGGLLSMQDNKIRDIATTVLKEGSQNLSQDEFDAMKSLVTTAPQQTFLGTLFGKQQDFTPDDFITKLDYKTYLESSVGKAAKDAVTTALQPIPPVPDTVSTAEDLGKVDPKKVLSTDEVNNVVKNLGQDSLVTGGIADTLTKTMLGITGGNKINTPQGVQDATAEKLKGIVDNAQNIQTTLVGGTDPSTGEKKESIITDPQSYGIDKPMGSGPPSVTEIYNAIHGMNIYGGGGPSVGSAGQDNIGGVSSPAPDITQPIMANKGALVTKPKRKAAPKKRTPRKGLGNKTKAT
jgi:hypothetical protein